MYDVVTSIPFTMCQSCKQIEQNMRTYKDKKGV